MAATADRVRTDRCQQPVEPDPGWRRARHMRDKRGAVLLGIAGVGLAALLLCVTAARGAVYLALAVQGLASSLIGPGIAATSLALVGHAALSERMGRNARFPGISSGLAAGVMGIAGS